MSIDLAESGFNVIVHGQGIRFDIPTYVEINCRTSIPRMEAFTQEEWEWVSQGDLFQGAWKEAFDRGWSGGKGGQLIPTTPPLTIEELLADDPGVIHVAGMIVQGFEAMFEGKNVFFRNPETLLHPATERYIVSMFKFMLNAAGSGKGTITKTDKRPEKTVGPKSRDAKGRFVKAEKVAAAPAPNCKPYEDPNNIEHCLEWLGKFPPTKEIAKLGEQRLTAPQLIEQIRKGSLAGKQIVDIFVSKRDSTPLDTELHQH